MSTTLALLQRLFPAGRSLPDFAAALDRYAAGYGVDTPRRLAAFLAQTGHESTGLTRWVEVMTYSTAGRILEVFGQSRHSAAIRPDEAPALVRNPQALAERVYGLGNSRKATELGNTQPGDGWRFRGRGLIQVTGRANVTRLAAAVGRSVDAMSDWLETPEGATVSALWFWQVNRLNRFADGGDFEGLTRAINGGLNGIQDRRSRLLAAQQALGV